MPDFSFERNIPDLFAPVQGLVAGIDEAGRGPWAGPVVAGAVIFPNLEIPDYLRTTLNDSKKLTAAKLCSTNCTHQTQSSAAAAQALKKSTP